MSPASSAPTLLAPALALALVLAGTLGAGAQGLPALSVGEDRGEPGDTVHPVLRLRDPGSAVAFQCQVRVDPSALLPGTPSWNPPDPALRLASGNPSAGLVQLVVYSEELAHLPGDLAVTLPFRVASRTPPGRRSVSVENVRFVSSAGSTLPAAAPMPGAVVVGAGSPVVPVIAGFGLDPQGRLRLELRAPGAATLTVEFSDDLREWRVAGTVIPDAAGSAVFTSEALPRPGHRFFRVLAPGP